MILCIFTIYYAALVNDGDRRKPCPIASMSTSNSTCLGLNPVLDGERLVTEPHQFFSHQCYISSAVDSIVK